MLGTRLILHVPQAQAGWSTPGMLDKYIEAMQAEAGAIEAFRGFNPWQ